MKKSKKSGGIIVSILVLSLIFLPRVSAKEMSAEFKKLLNTEGKLIINGAKPTERNNIEFLFENLFLINEDGEYEYKGYAWDNIPEDMSKVDFTINYGKQNEETHTVEIAYTYDESIKKMVDGYVSKIPEDLEYFQVKDLEIVNWWVNGKGDAINLINYSGELKEYFNHKNFVIDLRMGGAEMFSTYASGIANFTYNNTVYAMRDGTGVMAKHIIYIDDKAETSKDKLITTIQTRIDDYIGKNKVKVTYGGDSVYDLYINDFDETIKNAEEQLPIKQKAYEVAETKVNSKLCDWNDQEHPEFNADLCTQAQSERNNLESEIRRLKSEINGNKAYKEYFIEEYNKDGGEYNFLKSAVNGNYFKAETEDNEYLFIIVKDSSKMIKPVIKTSDIETDITISTDSNSLPLDTTIAVSKLTSGEDYDKIMKILNVANSEMFDLTLFSSSIAENITKLKNGTFEVRIPISEKFKDKDLVVYYVDEDSKKVEHKVTKKDGYAIFTTDHFSIYTLAETTTTKVETNDKLDETPKTGINNITNYLLVLTLTSATCLITLKKKRYN